MGTVGWAVFGVIVVAGSIVLLYCWGRAFGAGWARSLSEHFRRQSNPRSGE